MLASRQLEERCDAVPGCGDFSGPKLGAAVRADSWTVTGLLDWAVLRAAHLFAEHRDLDLHASTSLPACASRSPRRILTIAMNLRELSPFEAQLSTAGRVRDALSMAGLPPGVRPFVINLGAGDDEGEAIDGANCLVEQGFGGWLCEVDADRAGVLRDRLAGREDIQLIEYAVEPKIFPYSVLSTLRDVHDLSLDIPFPALLKVDVDNGDCVYLKSWLDTGFLPLTVQIEIVHSFLPPHFGLSFPFSTTWLGTVQQQYDHAQTLWTRGCSLGAVLPLLRDDYVLVAWGHKKPVDAEFALGWWARSLDLPFVELSDVAAFWYDVVSYRERLNPVLWHGPSLDIRSLGNASMPLAEQHEEVTSAYHLHMARLHDEGLLPEDAWAALR